MLILEGWITLYKWCGFLIHFPSHVEWLYLYRQLHSWTPESLACLLPIIFSSPKTWASQLELWHFSSLISCPVDTGVMRIPVQSRIIFWPCCVHAEVNPEDKCACSCKFCQQLQLLCPVLEINHDPHFVSRGFPELSGCLFLTFLSFEDHILSST